VTPPSSNAAVVVESNLFHVEDYTNHFLDILRALCSAASHHFDRRCRILALNSLSIVSKAVVGKLVISSIYRNMMDNARNCTRLQDEICNDVVMNIISCALEDDDGVTTVAFETLGRLLIDSRNDLLMREIRLITGDASPLTFSHLDNGQNNNDDDGGLLCPFQDLDYSVENSKIRKRILCSIVAPKIRHLFTRILLLKSMEYRLRCLPFLNEVVTFIYSWEETRHQEYKHDKKSFASRWYELDTTTLVQEYVDLFLLPLVCLKYTSEGVHYGPAGGIETGIMTASYGLMMVTNSRGYEIWIEPLMNGVVANLELALDNLQRFQSMEIKMEIVAYVLVALRRLNIERQMELLPRVISFLTTMPSTRVIPHNLTTGALHHHEDGSRRRPARCGYWTEVAISFLFPEKNLDVMSGVEWSPQHFRYSLKYRTLQSFLQSEIVSSIMADGGVEDGGRKSVINLAHEMVFVFCSIAHAVGNSVMRSATTRFGREIWMASSLCLLDIFMPCLGWTCATDESFSFHEGSSTFIFAAQRAYVELLKTVLVHYGKIIPNNSIYYHFIMSEEHSENVEDVISPWEVNDILENDISVVLDKVIQQFMSRALTRKIRLSILCLLTDAWIQNCQSVIDMDDKVRKGNLGPVDIDRDIVNIKERHVRNILSELGSEISKLIDGEKKRRNISHLGLTDPDVRVGEELRSLLTCISCVESIAYAAQLCANHFITLSNHVDVEENSRYLVSISMLVLKGQGKVETEQNNVDNDEEDVSIHTDVSSHVSNPLSPPHSPRSRARITAFTSECTQAAKRIRNFVGMNDDAYECFSVDFNCLCPLLKRPNFGVQTSLEDDGLGDESRVQCVNSLWKLVDRWTLLECDPEGTTSYSRPLDISIVPCLDEGKSSKSNNESRVLFHLYHQQTSHLLGCALISKLLCFGDETTNGQRYFNRESMYKNRDDKYPSLSKKGITSISHHDITGYTDPLYATMSCSTRRCIQGLTQEDMNLVVTLAMHNVTPVHLERDIEMSFIILPRSGFPTRHDKANIVSLDSAQIANPVVVKTNYSNGLKAKDHLIWELTLEMKDVVNQDICVSILLPEVPKPSNVDNSNEKIFDAKFNLTLERMVTEVQVLIPSPEVFYFGKHLADEKMFLFMWQNMRNSAHVVYFPDELSYQSKYSFLTDLPSFEVNIESKKVKAWALASTAGCHHVLAVVTSPSDRTSQPYKLQFKSSDESLLQCLLLQTN